MSDLYAHIAELDEDSQHRIADELEARAADEQQREFLEQYLSGVQLPTAARVLEIGCGTGAVARYIAGWEGVAMVEGVDPSAALLSHARDLAQGHENLRFVQGDGRSLPQAKDSFDLVVLHCTLTHIPEPQRVLSEAWRVLEPWGQLLVFDADYGALSFAKGAEDPLDAVARAAAGELAYDPWLVRSLPLLLRRAGFVVEKERAFAYKVTGDAEYALSLVDRGVDALQGWGWAGGNLAAALKNEARRRVALGIFHAMLPYAFFLARKPQVDYGAGI